MARYFSEQTLLDMKDKDMNYVYDLTDLEEYLAGVPTASVVPKTDVANVLLSLKREIHDKATYPHGRDTYAFVNLKVFDAVLNNFLMKYSEEKK